MPRHRRKRAVEEAGDEANSVFEEIGEAVSLDETTTEAEAVIPTEPSEPALPEESANEAAPEAGAGGATPPTS